MLFECVPNVSAGRDRRLVEALRRCVESPAEAKLLHATSDSDHNRTVLTLVGSDRGIEESILALFEVAVEAIDLTQHEGVHPCVGAVDVVPVVPLEATMEQAVALARRIAERAASEFALPVFLYEEAATREVCRNLASVRRGGLENLTDRMGRGLAPDYGPGRPHPTAGVSVIGARDFLVAFNALLSTDDVSAARRIATQVRESSGGLPGVKAIGVYLQSRHCAQVSMNLVDYRTTSPLQALEAVEEAAAGQGVRVRETELIGLLPAAAVADTTLDRLRLHDGGEHCLLEHHLAAAGLAWRSDGSERD